MAAVTKIGDLKVHTNGDIPAVGTKAPGFVLVNTDLKDVTLESYKDHRLVLNIFPSVDTSTCAQSVREFNRRAASLSRTVVMCISKDLPFAMKRFCATEGIDRAIALSDFRTKDFVDNYHVEMTEGPLKGLFARIVIVIDEYGTIKYSEVVPLIGQEPDYDAALKALQ